MEHLPTPYGGHAHAYRPSELNMIGLVCSPCVLTVKYDAGMVHIGF